MRARADGELCRSHILLHCVCNHCCRLLVLLVLLVHRLKVAVHPIKEIPKNFRKFMHQSASELAADHGHHGHHGHH